MPNTRLGPQRTFVLLIYRPLQVDGQLSLSFPGRSHATGDLVPHSVSTKQAAQQSVAKKGCLCTSSAALVCDQSGGNMHRLFTTLESEYSSQNSREVLNNSRGSSILVPN
jgi:hypothetical protein